MHAVPQVPALHAHIHSAARLHIIQTHAVKATHAAHAIHRRRHRRGATSRQHHSLTALARHTHVALVLVAPHTLPLPRRRAGLHVRLQRRLECLNADGGAGAAGQHRRLQ
ncbi:MAG: hypothetical protein GY740_24140, partial [Gammaproteobacteria bacterium]|nr:hypothetical protein [Gammaproteobacteria bacterium]